MSANILSSAQQKLIRSLQQKKYRVQSGLFLAEGVKLVEELLPHFECELIAATADWFATHTDVKAVSVCQVTEAMLTKVSMQQTPQEVLALFKQPVRRFEQRAVREQLVLVLDGVQDPGNLGTIVRIADWYGINHIFCSMQCADIYNPKTIQATMGAVARVALHYVSLPDFLQKLPADTPIYGTLLDGKNIYGTPLTPHGIIVMGSEGKGISEQVRAFVNTPLYLPCYPPDVPTSESLNVSVAAAITCAEFRRRVM